MILKIYIKPIEKQDWEKEIFVSGKLFSIDLGK